MRSQLKNRKYYFQVLLFDKTGREKTLYELFHPSSKMHAAIITISSIIVMQHYCYDYYDYYYYYAKYYFLQLTYDILVYEEKIYSK